MENRRIWTPSAFWFRFALFAALFVLPFIEHLIDQRYPFLRSEVAVSVLLIAAACLLLASLTRRAYLFYTVLVAVLAVMQVPHVQLWHPRLLEAGPIWLLPAGLVVFGAVSYWMREKFCLALLVFLAASFASGSIESLLGKQLIEVRRQETVNGSGATPGRPAHVIYLILDEYMGPAGFPESVKESQQAVRSIYETFVPRGFTVYDRAFSHYDATSNALPSLLDLKLMEQSMAGYREDRDPGSEFKIFPHFRARGYKIHLYRARRWSPFGPLPETEQDVSYDEYRIGSAADLPLPFLDRLWLVNGTHAARNLPMHLVVKNIKRRYLNVVSIWWAQTVSLQVLDLLLQDILEAEHDTLFLAHLLAPHFTYVYRADGSIRPLSEIVVFPRAQDTPPSDPNYPVRHARYAEQVRYLNLQLGKFLDTLEQNHLLDSATVVLHGDHGSRIVGRAGKENSFRLLLESFSSILAVKKPDSREGRTVPRKGSLITFLQQELYPEMELPAAGLDSVYYPASNRSFQSIPFLQLWTERDQADSHLRSGSSKPRSR